MSNRISHEIAGLIMGFLDSNEISYEIDDVSSDSYDLLFFNKKDLSVVHKILTEIEYGNQT